ncbi:FAD-binding protein [Nocardioides zeae]
MSTAGTTTSGARDVRRVLQARGVPADAVRDRPLDLAVAASDASHYLLEPAAHVLAGDERDVARVLAACAAEGLSVTFRAGGTSLSGQAGTRGVLVDVRRGSPVSRCSTTAHACARHRA